MKILVTGASSYVGARLYLDLTRHFGEENVIGTYNSKQLSNKFVHLDLTDNNNVSAVVQEVEPDIIIHVASVAVPAWCVEHPKETIEINENGTKSILDAANSIGAKIIYISTTAAVNPIDVYRKSKLTAEETVKQCKAGFVILRLGFVMGFSPNTENDRAFNRLLNNIDKKVPAIYDTSWKTTVAWLGHISEITILAAEKNLDKETIPIVSPPRKSRFEIASDILSKFGVQVTPTDEHSTVPPTDVNDEKLREMGLPTYTYEEIVPKMVEEIKHRQDFVLS
jgi:dTDP-4-dehydrorhamnose reductase